MLEIPDALLRELESHALEGYPSEVCGFLLGVEGDIRRVRRVCRGRNLMVGSGDRYLLDPDDFLRVDREARAEGVEILGFYHSHPDHPPVPSSYDRERAWPWYSYVILATKANGVEETRSWRLEGDRMGEEKLQLISDQLVKSD